METKRRRGSERLIETTLLRLGVGTLAGLGAGAVVLGIEELLVAVVHREWLWAGGPLALAYVVVGGLAGGAVALASSVWRPQPEALRRERWLGWPAVGAAVALGHLALIERVNWAVLGGDRLVISVAACTLGALAWYAACVAAAGPGRRLRGVAAGALAVLVLLLVQRDLVAERTGAEAVAASVLVAVACLTALWLGRRLRAAELATAALLALLPVLALAGWAERHRAVPASGVAERSATSEAPHVVLVVWDTARGDVFDAVVAETAEGRAFAEALGPAAWFDRHVAVAPYTIPTMGTLLTGTYPVEHALRPRDRHGERLGFRRLAPEVRTLAETLHRRGWSTAALSANWVLLPERGLARGFQRYEILSDPQLEHSLNAPLRRFLPQLWQRLQPGRTYRLADLVADRAISQLERDRGKGPRFLWYQFMDPHVPIATHDDLSPDPDAAALSEDRRAYRDEMRFVLRETTRLLRAIERELSDRPVLLVFTSDHGEVLPSDRRRILDRDGTYSSSTHGHGMTEELVRVPLVVRPPWPLQSSRRHRRLVSQVDVAPTILEIAGVDPEESGHPLAADAESLVPWLRPAAAPDEAAVRRYALAGHNHRGPPRRMLRAATWKLVHYPVGGAPDELYDLAADPGERRDLAADRPEQVETSRRLLETLWAALPTRALEAPAELSEEDRERLRALGYL